MRLALFLPSLVGGGAEKMLFHLACGFAERGLSVDMVLAQARGVYLERLPASVRVVDLAAPRVRDNLTGHLLAYLRQTQPDALLSTIHYTNIVAIWGRMLARTLPGRRVTTRVVVREDNHLSRRSHGTGFARGQVMVGLMPWLARWFYPRADAVVAVSQGVADDLAATAGLAPAHIRVIYNPVVTADLPHLAAQPAEHPWLATPAPAPYLDAETAPPVILAVGRLSKQKDFPTLLHAFQQVVQQRPARLLILGEGSERPHLEQLVHDLGLTGVVDLPGFAANPYAAMSRAALFVLASAWEGLPNALIEALACGAPVVATDCESGPREILADGRYGPLVPVGDVAALAGAMLATLADPLPAAVLRERGTMFTVGRAVDAYLEVLGVRGEG